MTEFSRSLSGDDRHKVLSSRCNIQAFCGQSAASKQLRDQTIATQLHSCSSYCRPGPDQHCRFSFPLPLQKRESLARRSSNTEDKRLLALAPRNDCNINSTHPLLTAMFRANTDVTVITGNSIAECMYVCGYAVKADKFPLFDTNALSKLTNLEDKQNHGKLLAAIARGSESVRAIRGQEVADNLIGNPLVFKSATILHMCTNFIFEISTSLSLQQKAERKQYMDQIPKPQNLLLELEPDDNCAIDNNFNLKVEQCPGRLQRHRPKSLKPTLHEFYMRRPAVLEVLTASEFHTQYICKKLCSTSAQGRDFHLHPALKSNANGSECNSLSNFIARKRPKPRNRPEITHILKVPASGKADEASPLFAAAAIALHVPYRSP